MVDTTPYIGAWINMIVISFTFFIIMSLPMRRMARIKIVVAGW